MGGWVNGWKDGKIDRQTDIGIGSGRWIDGSIESCNLYVHPTLFFDQPSTFV
jgi:hypothetical protein